MKIKKLSQLLIIIVLTIVFSFPSEAQEKGRIGINVKAQYIPQVGISYGISNKIQTRVSTYMDFNEVYLLISSLSLLFSLSSDESFSKYIGPDITLNSFEEEFYFGLILGAQYNLHQRFKLFLEIGPSIGNVYGCFTLLNTGVGINYYFK